MTDPDFELIAGPFRAIGEGPAWDGRALYFSLIDRGVIMRYDPVNGSCVEWVKNPLWTNGLVFGGDGKLYACCVRGRSILRYGPTGVAETVVDRLEGLRLNTPNDLAVDAQGRVWFTNPWNAMLMEPGEKEELGCEAVLRADPSPDGGWRTVSLTRDLSNPNGILVSHDQRRLYVSQCDYGEDRLRELRAYPIAEDGSLGPYVVLHQFGRDHRGVHRAVDGMCLDDEGNIIATAGWRQSGPGPMIYVFSPEGRVLETWPAPVDRLTNCTFGDEDLASLYVTSAEGALFRLRTGRRGRRP